MLTGSITFDAPNQQSITHDMLPSPPIVWCAFDDEAVLSIGRVARQHHVRGAHHAALLETAQGPRHQRDTPPSPAISHHGTAHGITWRNMRGRDLDATLDAEPDSMRLSSAYRMASQPPAHGQPPQPLHRQLDPQNSPCA